MIFDLFHSLSDPLVGGHLLGYRRCLEQFLDQVRLAEALGVGTVWVAESHFSSEVQKGTSCAAIPHYSGEIGLNSDSFQLLHLIASQTKRIGLGTAIHNIVGGSGGPIASADRVNSLRFCNQCAWSPSRKISVGVASGRFAYQNEPFGLVPRDEVEQRLWPWMRRVAFCEALEIFLRLISGESLSSDDISRYQLSEDDAHALLEGKPEVGGEAIEFPVQAQPRWKFEKLRLVPELDGQDPFSIVLGSSDPMALEVADRFWDVDLFNLSFTPPEKIEDIHRGRFSHRGSWCRSRLPRTVLVFVDPIRERAYDRASRALDVYIEGMRGTAVVPEKDILMQRALIGDADEVREQLRPGARHGFHPEDRLMLWFEFNQPDGEAVKQQMRHFFDQVVSRL